jgi:hypothetical protein
LPGKENAWSCWVRANDGRLHASIAAAAEAAALVEQLVVEMAECIAALPLI